MGTSEQAQGAMVSGGADAPPRAAHEGEARVSRPAEDSGRAFRVLVVDDNEDAAEMLAEWIAMDGHETSIAHDGADALSAIQRLRPDVVLLDIGLPVMDGYEVARILGELGLLERMVVVALTGYGQAVDRVRSAAAGFRSHLVKPVDLDALSKLLASLAEERRS